MPNFRKIWRALFSRNTRFEIRPFALSPVIIKSVRNQKCQKIFIIFIIFFVKFRKD